jgi:ABC-type phosphate transport system permease subunit
MTMRLGLTRRRLATLTEPIVEWAIRICGWSSILFVFAIFFFVLREGFPVLVGTLDIREFFTSVNWRPDSTILSFAKTDAGTRVTLPPCAATNTIHR